MDNCVAITPGILCSNHIISEHKHTYIYIYMDSYTSEIVAYVYIAQVKQCYPGAIFHPQVNLMYL